MLLNLQISNNRNVIRCQRVDYPRALCSHGIGRAKENVIDSLGGLIRGIAETFIGTAIFSPRVAELISHRLVSLARSDVVKIADHD